MKCVTRSSRGAILALLFVLFFGFARPADAVVVYVNKNAPGTVHDGTSWGTAFTSLKPAVDAAAVGDEVWVVGGTYPESIDLGAGVGVYGGFAGTETDRSQRDVKANTTILDGNNTLVTGVSSSAQGALLDGLCIRNYVLGAHVLGDPVIAECSFENCTFEKNGRGIFAEGAKVTVSHGVFTGNSLGVMVQPGSLSISDTSISGSDTGLHLGSVSADIVRCNITGRTSSGTGIYQYKGTANVSGCTLDNNYYGLEAASAVTNVVDCVISGSFIGAFTNDFAGTPGRLTIANSTVNTNQTGINSFGHALTVSGSTIKGNGSAGIVSNGGTVSNCNINGNGEGVETRGPTTISNCSITGGQFGVYMMDPATIVNCTITGNVEGMTGFGMSVSNSIVADNVFGIERTMPGIPVNLTYNDVYGNTMGNYQGVADPTGTNGNISADPQFADRVNGNYRLHPGSPCIDSGDDSVVTVGATDLDGNPRKDGTHVDMGAYEAIAPARDPWTAALNAPVAGGLTVAERVAYVAGSDGKLYARNTTDGAAVAGFPVDINLAVGAPVKLPSRPAVYYGKTGKSVYLTTDRGDVVRVLPDGQVAWHVRPVYGRIVSTPAVTPAGEVFVNLSTGEDTFNNYVFKLDESTGIPKTLSPFLGYTTAADLGDYSPAANSRYLYVNAGWSSWSGLTVLNQDNMMVRSSFAAGEQCLSPLLLGSDLILASKRGKVYKMNAVTLNPDTGFGRFGVADVGVQITASPFADAAGSIYLGTADGRILRRAAGSPNFQTFTSTSGRIAGLTINRAAGVLGFGTSDGNFVQVPLDNPLGAVTVSPGGPISTGTVYESLTDRFIVVTDSGVLCGYPSVR